MNKILILFLIFFNQLLYSQNYPINDSVIILDEVIINNKIDDNNYTSKKINKKSNHTLSISKDYSFVTKVIDEKIKGKIKTIEFFFDEIKKEDNKDVFFELVLLDENNKLQPGNNLNQKPFLFKISNNKKYSIKLNLEKYNIIIEKPFFIGLRKKNNNDEYDFKTFLINNNKTSSDIYINVNNQIWLKPNGLNDKTIKVKIETENPE